MAFSYDSRGVKPSNQGGTLPPGEYLFEIVKAEDAYSRSGSPMVKILCRVEKGPLAGAALLHNVTFLPSGSPGAGIAAHFLKSIGEPWEESESLDVDSSRWIGKKFIGSVVQDPYKRPDGTEVMTSKIRGVEPTEIPF